MTRRASKSELNHTQTLLSKRQKTRENLSRIDAVIKKNSSLKQ